MIVARQGSLLARLTRNDRLFKILAVSPTLLAQSITQSLPISRRSSHLKRYLSGVTCHIYLAIKNHGCNKSKYFGKTQRIQNSNFRAIYLWSRAWAWGPPPPSPLELEIYRVKFWIVFKIIHFEYPTPLKSKSFPSPWLYTYQINISNWFDLNIYLPIIFLVDFHHNLSVEKSSFKNILYSDVLTLKTEKSLDFVFFP